MCLHGGLVTMIAGTVFAVMSFENRENSFLDIAGGVGLLGGMGMMFGAIFIGIEGSVSQFSRQFTLSFNQSF